MMPQPDVALYRFLIGLLAMPMMPDLQASLIARVADLQATSYLNKLPKSFSREDRILVADPMLATGVAPPLQHL